MSNIFVLQSFFVVFVCMTSKSAKDNMSALDYNYLGARLCLCVRKAYDYFKDKDHHPSFSIPNLSTQYIFSTCLL